MSYARTLPRRLILLGLVGLIAFAVSSVGSAKTYYVSRTGDDDNTGSKGSPFRTIQHGLDEADKAGDRVLVRGGRYFEKLTMPHSGNGNGYIMLSRYRDERVILDGSDVTPRNQSMILIENLNYVRVSGLEIMNFQGNDGSGVRVLGSGHHIQIQDNEIHEIRGTSAMGVTVYGTEVKPISNIIIRDNHIYDCDASPSEGIAINGNVAKFRVEYNLVHDINNIGIDAIGGEKSINPDQSLVARNGSIRGNEVYNARSDYGGGYAAGIYVDGGRSITVEQNEIYGCDLGLEVGAENPGVVSRAIRVRNNLIYLNDKAGIVFGGYAQGRGRVERSRFCNNTVYKNDTLDEGVGQLWIQWGSKNVVANNIFWAADNGVLTYSGNGNTNNSLDYNLWFADEPEDTEFTWQSQTYSDLDALYDDTGQSAHGLFDDPKFRNGDTNFDLRNASPAIDAGTMRRGWFAPDDYTGVARPLGEGVDIGAFER